MAIKLAGERGVDWRLKYMLTVNPEKIVVNNELRGRWLPPSERDILNLAISFAVYGQFQPCEVRKMDLAGQKDVPVLNSGFTRCEAGRRLRKGFIVPENWVEAELVSPEEGVKPKSRIITPGEVLHDPDFMLSVVAINCNDQEAFERNIEENLCRTDTSDIDDAHNQEKLRRYGYSDADIARKFKYLNQSRVTRLKRLLQLPEKVQMLVHEGRLPTNGAIDLLDAAPEDRDRILAEATSEEGKINGQKIRTSVRDTQPLADFQTTDEMHKGLAEGSHPIATPNPGTPVQQPPRAKPRSLAELRRFIHERTPGDKRKFHLEPAIEAFLKTLEGYMAGRRNEKSLDAALDALLEAEVTGKTTGENGDKEEDSEAA